MLTSRANRYTTGLVRQRVELAPPVNGRLYVEIRVGNFDIILDIFSHPLSPHYQGTPYQGFHLRNTDEL